MFVPKVFLSALLFLCLCFAVCPATAQQAPADNALLSTLADSAHAHPNDEARQLALEAAVGGGLPDTLAPGLLPELPVDSAAVPGGLGMLIVPKAFLPTPAADPQQSAAFSKIAYLYAPGASNSAAMLCLFCRVHYASPDDALLAARMARLLALAHRTLVLETGQAAFGGDLPFDVWLMRSGKAGGEQWGRNLFFYDLDASRSSIEWIREVVHEYSHLALPPIGGYKDPEYWANGYLGERLIMRWMQRTPDDPALIGAIWGDFSGAANFNRLLVAPPLALYHKRGPNPQWLARTDAAGMDYLIGQTLTMDDRFGPHAVAEAFALLPREARAADLADAFSQVSARHDAAKTR